MTSLLTSQWLDACIIVPTEDCDIIARLAERAAAEGHAVSDLAGLRKYALTTHVDDAEASLVQSIKEKHRAIDAAAAAAAEEDAARAAKVAADAELAAAEQKAHEAARRVAAAKAARATKAAAARRAAAAKEEAARRLAAEKEAEARRIAAEAAAAEETESDDEDEWAAFWADTEAQLRGDVAETAEGYDVVLRGADELDVSVVEENSLRVAGVIIPSPSVQEKILALAKRRALRHGHGRVTEEDVIAASKGRFGRVDELVRLPANADVERATRSCRGRDVVVSVPRRAPPRRRVRRAVDPYYGRALFREPSYPPIYSY
mmetsp:Transcript_17120/g.45010  ORF Transcript_17120/g.45010 Transcript_17120/m.45010 type:complete len:319 (+) Transcript_17120:126-1082(+)